MDEATVVFFRRLQEDPENQTCMDLGSAHPQWASVSHGCFISLESSGVHRGLGVHISFVRSTTMDSWKPIQLKQMELGGNRRLKAFFRQHNIPDDMPIAQKYNTKAAEWYRKNLRALVDNTAPPPALPEGTGHLPANDALSSPVHSLSSSAPVGSWDLADSTQERAAVTMAAAALATALAASAPTRAPTGANGDRAEDDPIWALLGGEVGSKVQDGVKGALTVAKTLANKSKSYLEEKAQKAQSDGWVDTVVDTAKEGVGTAVEVGKQTITYVNDGGGKVVLNKTSEALGGAARQGISALGTSADWVVEQLANAGTNGKDNAAGLQLMSTGRMQGFGSDSLPAAAATQAFASGTYRGDAEVATDGALPNSSGDAAKAASLSGGGAVRPTRATAAAKAALWNDDDWND
eukprot:CAMPEP_0117598692 /NCGR_PEP_ID=MMETSP0784-20121206/75541_1 /TAXON_ID=39447 /ORGANISM="" /LENGTH=406 /DNA_ID=CAMNT_0005401177 /DNA_START=22 /DNA_END=1243 /DNA_ORIENTATION=+